VAEISPVRAGIIGAGRIGREHARLLDVATGVTLAAVCDSDPGAALAVSGPRGARMYGHWDKMFEAETLDAVWVCTPPFGHAEPAIAALERGVHVYLEKPIARTLPDAERIVAAASCSEAICVVGYQWRALEFLDYIRSALAHRPIAMLVARNYGPVVPSAWFLDRGQGDRQILERGSHYIDLARAIVGEIVAVSAANASVPLTHDELSRRDISDAVVMLLHFETGAIGAVTVAWTHERVPKRFSVDLLASDASLLLDLGPEEFRLTGVIAGYPHVAESSDPLMRSVTRFVEIARGRDRGRVLSSPADALRTLEVALACDRALDERRTVPVRAAQPLDLIVGLDVTS
jgi:myo-inositol 2-dehydrogenase / D-chiro-inositol 1-dehydrogenase